MLFQIFLFFLHRHVSLLVAIFKKQTKKLTTTVIQETKATDEEATTIQRMQQFKKDGNTDRANEGVDESCSNAGANFSDRKHKSFRGPFPVRHVGQGQVGLGHADGQVVEALERNSGQSLPGPGFLLPL